MRAADLPSAQRLVDQRASRVGLRDRLSAGEVLAVTLGEGPDAARIVLAELYARRLRADLIANLDAMIAADGAALAKMGVEG